MLEFGEECQYKYLGTREVHREVDERMSRGGAGGEVGGLVRVPVQGPDGRPSESIRSGAGVVEAGTRWK